MTISTDTDLQSSRAELIETCWAAVKHLGRFGYAEIIHAKNISQYQAAGIVRGWVRAGLIKSQGTGSDNRKLWCAVPTTEVRSMARGRTAEDNLWTAMRGLKSFSPTDLAAHANTDTVSVGLDDAQAYCRALLAAGHLSVARKAQPGRKEAIYRLARNTGPRAPREKRVRAVIDDNTDAVVVISGVAL